ncbi:MAG: hypothetical protein E7528_04970 [Ruminococcaceae bacterium]|nr:hypothetical protein [Oscillospiraceae bacterium]
MIYILAVYAVLVVLDILLIKKHPKLFYFLTTVILSSLAYFVVATEKSDLGRYYNMMEYMRSMGFEWSVDNYGSTNPLAFMFFYCISLVNNDALLPAIAVFTTYGFSFAVLHKAAKRFNASVTDVNIALIFLMLNMNFYYILSVIRLYMAFAIMAYFLYVDIVEKKHRILCFLVYFILCYFHYAMLVFLLLRLILIFTRKFKGSMSAVVTVLVPLIIFGGYKFLEAFTGGGTLLGLASDRLLGYQEYETFGIWQFAASMVRSALFVLLCLAGIWICSEWKRFELRKSTDPQVVIEQITPIKRNNDYIIYALYTTFTVFIFITNYQFVLRTPYFVQIMMSFVLLMILMKLQQYNFRYYTAVRSIIVIESLAHFAYLLLYVYRSMYFAF